MALITNRVPFSVSNPYRSVRPATSKIIFLSCEGSNTEEQYFERIGSLFSEIKSKIQLISVAEDAVHTREKFRTQEQRSLLGKCKPLQLVERIDRFKIEKDDIYEFSQHPEDEFWMITDIDDNLSLSKIEDWNHAVQLCEEKGYSYAVSNPFFEMWLLLHHDAPLQEDAAYAVTDTHEYETTSHYRDRLRALGVPLHHNGKDIENDDYDLEKVYRAIEQAQSLHRNRNDLCPKYYATTVYLLLNKIVELKESF